MAKHYDEKSVVRELGKKASVRINVVTKTINITRGYNDLGNSSWGKIDYLCKVHDYTYGFSGDKNAKKKPINIFDDDNVNKPSKVAKRERKLNMAANTKATMKAARTY